jgi:hypothetical protein
MDDSDSFKGCDDVSVACILAFRRASGVGDRNRPAEYLEYMRAKYGCTCGLCDGGFLSKRMRVKLSGN